MTFPEILTVEIIDEQSGKAIPNLLIFLEIIASHRNSYDFRLPLTDTHGKTQISRVDVINKISDCLEKSPMDYSSRIEDCPGIIKIDIPCEKELENRLSLLKKNLPDHFLSFSELVNSSVNSRFEPKTYSFDVNSSVSRVKISGGTEAQGRSSLIIDR
jgi:hypothetical protein